MTILSITPDQPTGQVGVFPRVVKLVCTDSYATITTAGYLSGAQAEGYFFYANDLIVCGYGTHAGTLALLQPSISATNVITLQPFVGAEVTGSITNGDFATFSGTLGVIKDAGYLPTNAALTKVAMASGVFVTGNIVQAADTAGTIIEGPVAANVILTSSLTTPDVNANNIPFNTTITHTQLATSGTVTLQASSGIKQYMIGALYLSTGTNFSGGGGDRLATISDGTSSFVTIPAANLQALTNTAWGGTAIPFTSSPKTTSVAGAAITIAYSGGTTDYSLGSLTLSGFFTRIA